MQIYLDSFGAYLTVRNGQFRVRLRSGEERLFAVREVSAVLLTKGTGLSADAALLAVDADVPVLLIDANTHHPLAQVSSGRPGSIATIRKNQLAFSRSAEGYGWAARTIAQKIEGQRKLLLHLAESPNAPAGFAAEVALHDPTLAALELGLRNWATAPAAWDAAAADAAAGQFRGQEGTASRLYFQKIGAYLNDAAVFDHRQARPAYDPFNAMLNYLYGILYTSVHLALLKSGLDPFVAVLHADRYGGAPTLVFDAIEPYRPWADRVAVGLAEQGGLLADTAFEPDPEQRGLWLSQAGKGAAIEAMLAFLDAPADYGGRQVKRRVQIDLEAQKLAVFLKGYG